MLWRPNWMNDFRLQLHFPCTCSKHHLATPRSKSFESLFCCLVLGSASHVTMRRQRKERWTKPEPLFIERNGNLIAHHRRLIRFWRAFLLFTYSLSYRHVVGWPLLLSGVSGAIWNELPSSGDGSGSVQLYCQQWINGEECFLCVAIDGEFLSESWTNGIAHPERWIKQKSLCFWEVNRYFREFWFGYTHKSQKVKVFVSHQKLVGRLVTKYGFRKM